MTYTLGALLDMAWLRLVPLCDTPNLLHGMGGGGLRI